ncbi:diacylglycerol kinase family protein [Cellulomonas sp. KRMCY2]|uniref:diacylglycerol/lipid kinase family protein n=1 Tax=Cellulomonas sp. KRMCY2 TaxID=1304865 RepID=UPI00045EAF53|nr:diacylglycerol kinase family protein [Cellulomonas sp. KRMCY2]
MTAPAPTRSTTDLIAGLTRSSGRLAERRLFVAAVAAYALWTIGVVLGWTDGVDAAFGHPVLEPRSPAGQLAEVFASATHPFVIVAVTVSLALRSFRRRQRRLARALALASLGVPLWVVQQALYGRPRPSSLFSDSVTASLSAYPAGHMVAATILTWVLVTTANAQRRPGAARWKRRIFGAMLVTTVGVDQWAMGTESGTDLIGGQLLGIAVAVGALWFSRVATITGAWRPGRAVLPGRQAAVIYNPTKVLELDQFRRRVEFALSRSGWQPTLWLETLVDDPGRGMARAALARGVDLVLVAGGDGTVRTVCAELAGSAVPVGLVPAGTGNLLCRNLGIPLDEDDAIAVALRGVPTAIDMVRWTVDGQSRIFAVMAGVGLDAQIMRDTDPRLKTVLRGGAYVVAAAQQVMMPAFGATVTVDGVTCHDGDAVIAMVGNVGRLQGGIQLIPGASPTDGELDVLVASKAGLAGLIRPASAALRVATEPPPTHVRGQRVDVVLDRPVAYQLDGDMSGEAMAFTAEVLPHALLVMTPQPSVRRHFARPRHMPGSRHSAPRE